MDWSQQVFGSEHMVTWWQECTRATLIFAFGLLLVRLAGRRAFAKWAAVDIVIAIIVGSSLSRALTGSAPLWGTLAACVLLMVLHWLLSRAASRWTAVADAVEGHAVELAALGRLERSNMRAFGVTAKDVDESIRKAGLADIDGAARVTLEPSGQITVVKAVAAEPAARHD